MPAHNIICFARRKIVSQMIRKSRRNLRQLEVFVGNQGKGGCAHNSIVSSSPSGIVVVISFILLSVSHFLLSKLFSFLPLWLPDSVIETCEVGVVGLQIFEPW